MTKFQKALKLYNKAMRHAYLNVGFRRTDKDIMDFNAIGCDKTARLGKSQREKREGGVIARGSM